MTSVWEQVARSAWVSKPPDDQVLGPPLVLSGSAAVVDLSDNPVRGGSTYTECPPLQCHKPQT